MKPFSSYELRDILENIKEKLLKDIEKLSNDEMLANDIDLLAENLYQKHYVNKLEIFDEDYSRRSIRQTKVTKQVDPFLARFYGETVEVDGICASFYFPYTGEENLFLCRASTFILSGYPSISVEDDAICLSFCKSMQEIKGEEGKEKILKELDADLRKIKNGVEFCNKDIESFNAELKKFAKDELEKKKKNVESFCELATMLDVPVEKSDFAVSHIAVKRTITPISHSYRAEQYYCISDVDYEDILNAIKHTASTFERTPSSYKHMQEEDLRNVLLAPLNAMYQGGVMGEAFRNKGKTDIAIERDNRAAFVAECKIWKGKKEIEKAIKQLDGYLTWRDRKTALIYFVRNKDFLSVINTAWETLSAVERIKSLEKVDENEFKCQYASEQNPGQMVKMRVFLFNIHC